MRDIHAFHEAKYKWSAWVQRQQNTNSRLRTTIETETNQCQRIRAELPKLQQRVIYLQNKILQAQNSVQSHREDLNIKETIHSNCEMSDLHCDYLSTYHDTYERRLLTAYHTMKTLVAERQTIQKQLTEFIHQQKGSVHVEYSSVFNIPTREVLDTTCYELQYEQERVFGIPAAFKAQIVPLQGCRFCGYNESLLDDDCKACTLMYHKLPPIDRLLLLFEKAGISARGREHLRLQYSRNHKLLEEHIEHAHLYCCEDKDRRGCLIST